ncbi:hypothetical protein L107_12526 [Cyanobium sp. Copco_Reservoir_LC18]|uniref:hypothetical protein n=1 Tax=Cyanobium sp. Copco_Reservoir_LC18 TaxID=1328305 RepID=UPI0013579815|nr:hypothetical protein [Cyanobium sp. Copco_Reservoir_LC18]KAF0652492.1 hypothetical protein L107_12526 [Cyanobium sp. Copco_Reservoir_LC18]
MSSPADDQALVADLARASLSLGGAGEPERDCWRVVHRHVHGMLPSEYDIREIDEDLFLAVLARRKADSAAAADDPA